MADQLQLTVKRCLSRYRFFSSNQPLVVAVSTGVDSMVLLHLLQSLVPVDRIVVAHVNHHLRQQSQQEEHFLRQVCQQFGTRLLVDQWTQHPEHGIESAARAERYHFFAQVMKKVQASFLLTAHHENDLAETMLMKLMRTGDASEVVGIREARPFADGQLLRPLLRIPKATLIQYAKQHDWQWYEDVTNQQDLTLRNRVRHHYLPEWERENPQALEHLRQFHDQLTALLMLKDELVERQLKWLMKDGQLDLVGYQQQKTPLRQWILRDWLNTQQIFNLPQQRLNQLDHFLGNSQLPSAIMTLDTDFQLIKNYQRAKVKKVQNLAIEDRKLNDFMVKFDHWYHEPDGHQWGIFSHPQTQTIAELWLTKNQLPLWVRQWRSTDQVRLKSGHHQSIRRILINQKVPLDQRASQLVVVDQQGQVLWLINHKTAWLERGQVRDQQYEKRYFCQK